MLKQALASLKHGFEHLRRGSDADRAFAFVHVDQAAELLLKEKVRRLNESIFEPHSDHTISLFEAKSLLGRRHVSVANWSDVEILHTQRNLIQHFGANPERGAAETYLKAVIPFFETFLKEQFKVNLTNADVAGYLPPRAERPGDKLLAAALAETNTHPVSAVIDSWAAAENATRASFEAHPGAFKEGESQRVYFRLLKDLGILSDPEIGQYQKLTAMRNKLVHQTEATASHLTENDAKLATEWAAQIVAAIMKRQPPSDGRK